MARTEAVQLNIRSRFARERAALLASQTGMTATQVVEEALGAYLPPPQTDVAGRLIRKGAILVMPAAGERITLEETNEAIEEARRERG